MAGHRRDPDPFLHEPWVVETSEKVTIYWTSEPPKGGQDCQGDPSIDEVVELAKPVGTRCGLRWVRLPARRSAGTLDGSQRFYPH
jgi:hypothetical protein